MLNRFCVPNAVASVSSCPNGPQVFDFDDGVRRVVKFHPRPKPSGPKSVYNELVSSRLGQLVGAPILKGLVVYVPESVRATQPGFHFAATLLPGEDLVPTKQPEVELQNSSELPIAAVFLAWLDAGDHRQGNFFLWQRQHGLHFLLLDMEKIFGSCNWTRASVETVHSRYEVSPFLRKRLSLDDIRHASEKLLEVDSEAIRACIQEDIPAEWNVPQADREAAARRLVATLPWVEEITRTLKFYG